jgi:hypothetical protein
MASLVSSLCRNWNDHRSSSDWTWRRLALLAAFALGAAAAVLILVLRDLRQAERLVEWRSRWI